MDNKLKNNSWLYTLGSLISAFAFMITALNVNTTCLWYAHQDELPKQAKKLRKF